MEVFLFYIATIATIIIAAYGAILIALSSYEVGRRMVNSQHVPMLYIVHLINGLLNLFVGVILFWRLRPENNSVYPTLLIATFFSLIEGFIRINYTKRLQHR